jgi:hypothetical protein
MNYRSAGDYEANNTTLGPCTICGAPGCIGYCDQEERGDREDEQKRYLARRRTDLVDVARWIAERGSDELVRKISDGEHWHTLYCNERYGPPPF